MIHGGEGERRRGGEEEEEGENRGEKGEEEGRKDIRGRETTVGQGIQYLIEIS